MALRSAYLRTRLTRAAYTRQTKRERREYIHQRALEMARSGEHPDFMSIELALRAEGYSEMQAGPLGASIEGGLTPLDDLPRTIIVASVRIGEEIKKVCREQVPRLRSRKR
jgi:hypothetical protein